MDDSWDSASSPDTKKKSYGKSKLSSLGGIPPVSPRRTKGGGLDESREFDPDLLFSPTNSQGSPAGTPIDYKKNSYNFDDSPKKSNTDYLSNFVLESNELEDSILGGLLGGGAKKTNNNASRPVVPRQRSPQAKLEPLDTSDNTSVRSRSPRKSSSPPKSHRQSNFRSSASDMNTSTFNEFDDDDDFPIAPAFGVKRASSDGSEPQVSFNIPASTFDPAMVPNRGKGRQAQPSFDASQDLSFLNEIQNDDFKPALAPGVKKFTDGLVRPSTSSSIASSEPYFPSTTLQTTPRSTEKKDGGSGAATAGVAATAAGSGTGASGEEDKEDDSAGLAFIPSFMEPGRQNRRRRQLDTSPGKGFGESGGEAAGSGTGVGLRSSGVPKLSDLDIALGLSGAPSVPKKAVVDPFSAVDKKIPTLEKQANAAFLADSDDSSSDDALFNRNRYNRKDSFTFSKPVPPTTISSNTSSIGGGAKTVGKEASQSFSSATAFPPPAAAVAAPMTAPSRVASFTPAKPGTLPESSALSPRQPESNGMATTAVPNYSNRTNSAVGGSQPGPAHGMKMSESFEETATGGAASNSPTSPSNPHSNASLASLPHISPVSSFRFNSGTGSGTAANTNASSTTVSTKNKLQAESDPRKDFSDAEDELDVSGIVRIDLEEDLLIPRSNRNGSLKSPIASSARPKTAASRSPRSSSESVPVPVAAVGDAGAGSAHTRSGSSSGPSGRLQTAAAVEEAAIRIHSPAGVLTEAVQAFDKEKENSSTSRRNSASSHLSTTSGSFTGGYGSAADSTVRERRPSFTTGGNLAAMATIEVPYSSFNMRKGTREDLPSMVEEPEREEVKVFSGSTRSASALPSSSGASGQSFSGSEQLVQQLQIDKQALEGRLLREIEELKVKLAHPQPASFKHAQLEVSAEEREHYRVLQDSNIKYLQEAIDQKRLIAALESEISRLKDEALIKARHVQDEIVWMKEKYEGEIKDVKTKNAIETEALERRQEDALASLKKLHVHEIESIKERYKSEDKFELIAGQLRTTSGSIQFIEQQLQSRQKGVEAMREGQIDARERLLADMEAKARERAEIAEAEGYRLKGILTHMEHVVSTLRDQGSEEKERLRQEHSRLQARQTAFEAERQALQSRNLEELAYIKQRSKEVEIELAKLTQEKQMAYEALSSAQHKLDSERAEFNVFVTTNKRAFESTENRLREEEQRIHRLRNEMLLERASLDERRAEAMKDIEAAEELKNILQRAKQENETEKAELRRISQSYKTASEEILDQQNEIHQQKESLEERELTLRDGFAQMKLAASDLSQREQGIRESLQMLERKRQALERADRECMEQRVVSAAHFREWSMRQSSTELIALPPPPGPAGQRFETWPRPSSDPQAMQQDAERNNNMNNSTAEQIFAKYAGDVHGGADASAQHSNNTYSEYGPTGRLTKSAEFDAGLDWRSAGPGPAAGLRPRESTFEPSRAYHSSSMSAGKRTASGGMDKENLYNHILSQQQADRPWIEVFQEKLQRSFQQGEGSKDITTGSSSRLPSELRTAQQALRLSRDHLARSSSTALGTQRLLQDESEFLVALHNKRAGPTPV